MSGYIFESHTADRELKRLKLIEHAFDETSITCMEKVPIRSGAHCLEIGAGAGSMMSWMGEKVGSKGRVVGIDKNTKYLNHFGGAPFEVLEGDFSAFEMKGLFDVVHCRYVLIHNPERRQMISKIKQVLKPGAMLVLEEPDFTSAKLLNDSAEEAQLHVNTAICKMFVDLGLNPAYGLSLPKKLEAEGFEVLDVHARLHFAPGLSPVAEVMAESAAALRDKYIATGEASASDLDDYMTNAKNDKYWSVYYSTISVIAKCPA